MKIADRIMLWVAEGFGAGRLRPAPGTWGSVVGILWLMLLLCAANAWVWLAGTLIGLALAVPICTRAERLLGAHDPSSVVLDEIAAVPLVWLGAVWIPGAFASSGPLAPTAIAMAHAPELATAFAAFRLFDIWKPGPIRAAQRLPDGLGVVADDVLAALAAGAVVAVTAFLRRGAA
ncbi:MAG: phosphatidylglycerophosphatase A [Verrucomicrobiae bacterium]|nr:phosphatidylglycerophosphatase A [Verrucomicrobiae bacterium]